MLDTSVLIASESGRTLDMQRLPQAAAVSAITITELHVGVLAAPDVTTRARRLATLQAVAAVEVLPVDEQVAARWAELRVHLAQARRRANVNDVWIAATALVHGIPVITQDDDFEPLDGVGGLAVVRV